MVNIKVSDDTALKIIDWLVDEYADDIGDPFKVQTYKLYFREDLEENPEILDYIEEEIRDTIKCSDVYTKEEFIKQFDSEGEFAGDIYGLAKDVWRSGWPVYYYDDYWLVINL